LMQSGELHPKSEGTMILQIVGYFHQTT
jgi:hypothetical protein